MPVPDIHSSLLCEVFVPCGHNNRRAGIIDAKPHGNSSPHMYIRSPRTLGRSCFGAATLHALSFSTYIHRRAGSASALLVVNAALWQL